LTVISTCFICHTCTRHPCYTVVTSTCHLSPNSSHLSIDDCCLLTPVHTCVCAFVCLVPPSIELSDRELVVTEHDTAQLPCVAAGFPQPTVSWIKDGRVPLDGAVDSRYQLHEPQTGSLRITDVQVPVISRRTRRRRRSRYRSQSPNFCPPKLRRKNSDIRILHRAEFSCHC